MTHPFRVTTWMAFTDFFAAIAVISICLFAVSRTLPPIQPPPPPPPKTEPKPKPAKTPDEYKSARIAKRLKAGPLEDLQAAVGSGGTRAELTRLEVLLLPPGSFASQSPAPSLPNEDTVALLTRLSAALFDRGLLQKWAGDSKLALTSMVVYAVGSGDDSEYLTRYSAMLRQYLYTHETLEIARRLSGVATSFTRPAGARGSIRLLLYFDLTEEGQREAEADYEANRPEH